MDKPKKSVRTFLHRMVQMGAKAGKTIAEILNLRDVLTKAVDKYKALHAHYGTAPRKHKGIRNLDTGYRYRPKCITGGSTIDENTWYKYQHRPAKLAYLKYVKGF